MNTFYGMAGLFFLSVILPTSLLALLALCLMRRGKGKSAAWRAGAAQAALLGIFFLPLAIVLLPKAHLPLLPPETTGGAWLARYLNPLPGIPSSFSPETSVIEENPPAASEAAISDRLFQGKSSLLQSPYVQLIGPVLGVGLPVLIWIAGMTSGFISLVCGALGLLRIRWASQRISDSPIGEALEAARIHLDYHGPVVLLVSSRIGVPMTWGLFHPKIAFPSEAIGWSRERLETACLHELAHVQRHDFLVQGCGRLAAILHWYNPLVLRLFAEWKREVEVACDDWVLRSGYSGEEYSRILFEVLRDSSFQAERGALGLAMARAATLEIRMAAILDTDTNRQPVAARRRWAVTLALVALVVAGAGIRVTHAPRADEAFTPEITAALQGIVHQGEIEQGSNLALQMKASYREDGWSAQAGRYLEAPALSVADVTVDFSAQGPRFRIAYQTRIMRNSGEASGVTAGRALVLGDGTQTWDLIPGAESHLGTADGPTYLTGDRFRIETAAVGTARDLLTSKQDIHSPVMDSTVRKENLNGIPVISVTSLMDANLRVWRTTWWFDPARNYSLVQREQAVFGKGEALPDHLELTRIQNLRQIAPGIWYPVEFTTDFRKYDHGEITDGSFLASTKLDTIEVLPGVDSSLFTPSAQDRADMAAPKAVPVAAASTPAAAIPAGGDRDPAAMAIFQAMKDRYANCTAFSCTGTYQESADWPVPMTTNRLFDIRFARPSRIRIEYQEPTVWNGGSVTGMIYVEGGKIFGRDGIIQKTEPFSSVDYAIGTLAGVSGSTTYLLPSLLIGKRGYFDFWGIEQEPDQTTSGQDCNVIKLETKGFGYYTLFVRKADATLIRSFHESDAAVMNQQRERAHAENSHWFDDPGGPRKIRSSSTATMDFTNIAFDPPMTDAAFTQPGKE